MKNYNPESWCILELTDSLGTHYRLFGGWESSWRMNSGITSFNIQEDLIFFYGESGSCYGVSKESEGIRGGYLLDVVQQICRGDISNTPITFDSFIKRFNKEEDNK